MYKYQFLRLLLPLMGGIFCGDLLFSEHVKLPLGFLLFTVFFFPVVLIVLFRATGRQYAPAWPFSALVVCFFFLLGVFWCNWQLQEVSYSHSESKSIYRAVVAENPERKEKSFLIKAHLISRHDLAEVTLIERNVLLYFSPDSGSSSLRMGDEVLFSSHIALPKGNGNPDEFDYGRYLTHQGVSGSGFVSAGEWKVITHHDQPSIARWALHCRERVLELYKELGFQKDEFAVLAALTVGYKKELSEEIRESFSVSGASHVLALSGLHIGFLYALLFFFLRRIPGSSVRMALFRAVVIIVLLWAFAFITGLSSSVVRSVIMFSLLALSQVGTRQAVSLNTLAIAGMGMLIYNPAWLFDVGFQLSFCAVAAILLIQPGLYNLIAWGDDAKGVMMRSMKWLWGLITVSVAAQIGTAPLVLFYFSRFSTHFLITNIWVIPLVSLIMYAAVLMLSFVFFPALQQALAVVVRFLIRSLNDFVRWVEALPYSSVDDVWVYRIEVLLFYVTLLLFIRYTLHRKAKRMVAFLAAVLLLTGFHVWMIREDCPRESIAFYNVRNCPVIHCISGNGRSWLAYADSLPDEKRLTRAVSAYWRHSHLSKPVSVKGDYADDTFIRHDNILAFGDKRMCVVNDNQWVGKESESPLPVDYLYLCKGYTGKVEWLTGVFSISCVVLDSSLSSYKKNAFRSECEALGIACISLSDSAFLCDM